MSEPTFPLPAIRPVPLSRFDAEFAETVECAAFTPDGDIWLQQTDGTVMLFPGRGEAVADRLLELAERLLPAELAA
jgi:hypothetical protein